MFGVKCLYCHNQTELTNGKEIYPHREDLWGLRFWICRPCQAYVGCHRYGDGKKPLGTPAQAGLRVFRKRVHAHFDPLWRNHGHNRLDLYRWMADHMGIKVEDCHISHFGEKQCALAMKFIKEFKQENAQE